MNAVIKTLTAGVTLAAVASAAIAMSANPTPSAAQQAQYIADMANSAEAAILTELSDELRDWYMNLPREKRVEIAMKAAKETVKNLKSG